MSNNGERLRQSSRSVAQNYESQIEHTLDSIESAFLRVASIIFGKLQAHRHQMITLLQQKDVRSHNTYFGTAFFFPVKTIEDLDILEFRLQEKEFEMSVVCIAISL